MEFRRYGGIGKMMLKKLNDAALTSSSWARFLQSRFLQECHFGFSSGVLAGCRPIIRSALRQLMGHDRRHDTNVAGWYFLPAQSSVPTFFSTAKFFARRIRVGQLSLDFEMMCRNFVLEIVTKVSCCRRKHPLHYRRMSVKCTQR